MRDEMIMDEESGIRDRTAPEYLGSDKNGRERKRERSGFLPGVKLSSDLANVMKRDARNSATVSVVAPRFNSSA